MTTEKKNRGRLLQPALKQFSSGLVQAIKHTTGLSFPALDKELGYPAAIDSITQSYASTHQKKSRAVQAAAAQKFENRVAELLGRAPFKVVVRNIGTTDQWIEQGKNVAVVVDVPANFRTPRSPKNSERYRVLVGYEGKHLYPTIPKYGTKYPPSDDYLRRLKSQLDKEASHVADDPEEERERQAWLFKTRAWIASFQGSPLPEFCRK